MAKTTQDYSATAASNTALIAPDGTQIPLGEGETLPKHVNDAFRALMADTAIAAKFSGLPAGRSIALTVKLVSNTDSLGSFPAVGGQKLELDGAVNPALVLAGTTAAPHTYTFDTSDSSMTGALRFYEDASQTTEYTTGVTVSSGQTTIAVTNTTPGVLYYQLAGSAGLGGIAYVLGASAGGGSYADADVDAHLNRSTANSGEVLSWTGTDYDWVAQSGGGSSYTDADVNTHLNQSSATTGQVLQWNGSDYAWTNQTAAYTDSSVDAHLNRSTANSGEVLSWNGSDYDWVAQSGGGGLADVVDDTTPQLGGDLDLNSKNVTGTGNINITGTITTTSGGSVVPFYYANQAAFPNATTYHGAIAHSHADGAMYFAHGGAWNKLADTTAATTSAAGLMAAADKTKLDGIETAADVTDTANVTAAGAVMDSELIDEAAVKAINQGLTTTDSVEFGGLTVDTDTLYVDATDNRVGIGTLNPGTTLDVDGEIRQKFNDSTNLWTDISSNPFTPMGNELVIENNSTDPDQTNLNTPTMAGIFFRAGANSSISAYNTARIAAVRENGFNTSLAFATRKSGTGMAERMRIESNGNVGIGTDNPTKKLHVVGGDAQFNSVTVGRGPGGFGTNTAVGFEAINSNTSGVGNTALGAQALASNTTANNNTAIGRQALNSNTTGTSNTALGIQAMLNADGGVNNTFLGGFAGTALTSGSNNVAVGSSTGGSLTTGQGNVLVGRLTDVGSANAQQQTVVGFNVTGQGNYTTTFGGNNIYRNGGAGTNNTFDNSSDRRIKKNIVDNNDGLALLDQLRVRSFEYRTPEEMTELPASNSRYVEGTHVGFIAQELQEVLPECVNELSTGTLTINTSVVTFYLVNAVKELKAEIDALKGN